MSSTTAAVSILLQALLHYFVFCFGTPDKRHKLPSQANKHGDEYFIHADDCGVGRLLLIL